MAKEVVYQDDVTGEEGARTITFSVAERRWEIDLTDATIDKMVAALKRYIDKGREIKPRNGGDLGDVRSWLRDNGHPDLPDRGRIPQDLQDKYNAAHA